MNFSQLSFGYFTVKLFGFFIAAAFLLGAWHWYQRLKAAHQDTDLFVHHAWRWLVAGLVIGRLITVAIQPEIFGQHGPFGLFIFWEGTFHWYGALAGTLAAMAWDLRTHKGRFWQWADLGTPGLLFALLITDLGAFLTGTHYGTATELPWGVRYETFGVDIVTPVHPVALYGFIIHAVVFQWARTHTSHKNQHGRIALKAGAAVFFADFLLGFLSGNTTLMISSVQAVQVIALVLAGACIWLRRKH